MKVIQVLNHFLPRQLAGTEIYVGALSKGLLDNGVDNRVVIPNYGESKNNSYEVEGIHVTQFAEPSKVDRALMMGYRSAEGLGSFKNILVSENPDIVHFHELAGSNGISIHHVKAAQEMGFKVVFTFHLSKYTCSTGNLLYREKEYCDGKIQINKCAKCYLHSKSPVFFRFPLYLGGSLLNFFNLNTLQTKTKLGTALGTHFLIKKNRTHFKHLVNNSDKLVTV
jgi:glycogen synthase